MNPIRRRRRWAKTQRYRNSRILEYQSDRGNPVWLLFVSIGHSYRHRLRIRPFVEFLDLGQLRDRIVLQYNAQWP